MFEQTALSSLKLHFSYKHSNSIKYMKNSSKGFLDEIILFSLHSSTVRMRPCKLPAREQCVQAIRLTTLTILMLLILMLTSAILGVYSIIIGGFSRSSIIGLQSRHIPVEQQQIEVPKLHQMIPGAIFSLVTSAHFLSERVGGRTHATFSQCVTIFKSGCVEDCFHWCYSSTAH